MWNDGTVWMNGMNEKVKEKATLTLTLTLMNDDDISTGLDVSIVDNQCMYELNCYTTQHNKYNY